MKKHEGHDSRSRKPGAAVVHQRSFRISPLAQAMALALAAGATTTITAPAHAQQAFSPAWMAQKNMAQNAAAATGRLPNGMPASMLTSPQAQQQRANAQLQQSINNLNLAARGIAAQQAAQAAARAAAQNDASVPDGLADGGLRVDTNSLTAGWANANAPVQTRQADGRTNVAIQQTSDRAVLNWETFNVGRNTTVDFRQQADWAVLNRVNDPQARPSQIQGQIKADGTVLIANRNGIVFSGTSQVDTRNLVAAAAHISDSQFNANGIYSAGTAPSFTGAQGKVEVQAGARIATRAPSISTEGGGYVLLVGQEVHNAGDIATPRGQAVLAAGDSFLIKKGSGTGGNQASTTRGNEVTPQFGADSIAGKVSNTGLIVAREGDVTMVGRDVRQDGVALATTTVNTRGTVHLAAVGADGKVALGQGATTAVVIEDDGKTTALDSQRDGLRGPALVNGNPDIVAVADRRDQSRIEIASSGTVDFQADSLTLATGGQIAVTAAARTLVRDRAQIDVSGAVGVSLAMESNNVKINVQGNEQRDAPLNRDGKRLNNNDVWIDRRSLVFVPKGTNGYASDRWYTAGGLLEVGGYLGTEGHTASEWMAQGGTVTFGGAEVVTQGGSSINLSGGTLNVQTGFIRQTWLKGADGRLYEVSKAPGDQRYEGLYRGFEDEHKRWGDKTIGYFYNPLIGAQKRLENGYTVGRDAGKLVVATGAAVLEGGITAEAFQGTRQTQAPQAGLDGYNQSHDAASRRGQLIVGEYLPMFDRRTGALNHLLSANMDRVELKEMGDTGERIAAALDLATALPAERRNSLLLDAAQLNGMSLGAVRIAARDRIDVNADLQAAAGGNITLYGNNVVVKAGLSAHGGGIMLGNTLAQTGPSGTLDTLVNAKDPLGHVTLTEGARLDASGLWRNAELDPFTQDLAYANGGSVSIRGTGDVALQRASVIDVSSGAVMRTGGKTQAGKGGNVTLATTTRKGSLQLDPEAQLRGYGVAGGGTLSIQAGKVLVSDQPASASATPPGTLVLGGNFFDKGFSAYEITGSEGLTVAEGTQVDVTMPVYRFRDDARRVASGTGPARALELWTPPLYQEDAVNAVLRQRKGASLSLQAGRSLITEIDPATSTLAVGRGARIEVDPGQSIALRGAGQITIDGALTAHGGSIDVRQQQYGFVDVSGLTPEADGKVHTRSIWIGDNAVLDVSGRAHTATDVHGRTYGRVERGGSIVLGGVIDHDRAVASSADAYVIVRPGAKLDASGAQAVLDVPGLGPTTVATDGGRISLSSYLGLHIDGSLRAAAGGAGAAGGSLDIALESPLYDSGGLDRAQQEAIVPRELTVAQSQSRASLLPDDLAPGQADAALRYGKTRLSADRLGAGGFDNLTLLANGQLSFDGDVSLRMGQGLTLFSSSLSLAESSSASARVQLAAPYVKLSGTGAYYAAVGVLRPRMLHGMTPLDSTAEFSVQAGRLLDLGNSISFGTEGRYAMQGEFTPVHVERRGFEKVELASDGDIRFLLANDNDSRSRLWTHGGLTFAAAQLYPETGAIAQVNAGYRMDPVALRVVYDPDSVLRIERRGDAPAGVPYSAFGALEFGAAVIEQAGVVRAPLGSIRLGTDLEQGALNVALLPGSITSVSGAGLTMPYGGTTDGIDYKYDGRSVRPVGAGGGAGIRLGAEHVDVQAGAVLDLSGGGELTGAGFVAGRGGSTDARFHPLMQIGADGRFSLPSLSTNAVYAIVPGAQPLAAPASGPAGASQAATGRQITIGAGVPGLPAGTYTLMPSTYALLPGAFRVELNGAAGSVGTTGQALAMRNGSWAATGRLSVAGTGLRDSLPSQVIVTPADVLRTYAQYNETSYADFVRADAARLGVPRGVLPADAGSLAFVLGSGRGGMSLDFDGLARFQAAQGGRGGTAMVLGGDVEVLGAGQSRTAGFEGASVRADTLNDLHADRLVVGARPTVIYGQQGRYVGFSEVMSDVKLRAGAVLKAPEVFLAGRGNLAVEAGAGISTLGQGAAIYDSSSGFVYQPGDSSLLAVSNGRLDVLAPAATGKGSILLGVCNTSSCSANSTFYSEGTITAATNGAFELSEASRYGTRHLALAVGGVNAGSVPALADAQARGVLASGLTLNQDVLQRLLNGDTSTGAPALESLTLTARDAINFYGSVTLDTTDPATGKSRLDTLVLGTPAIYGSGGAGDVATIRTRNLVWSGATQAPGAVASGGAGTGSGTLDIQAERIELGDMPHTVSNGQDDNARLALGFATVKLGASDRLTSSRKGSLSVYQSQGAYEDGKGYAYSGGNLEIATPLVTGEAGAVNRITAGGTLRIGASASNRYDAVAGKGIRALGADLALNARDIVLDTAIVLPTGKLTLTAKDDIALADGALIDVGGRKLGFNDLDKFSWGGDVGLESQAGSIRQAAGATIDLSAQGNRAGTLKAVALGSAAGVVDLQGRILGGSSGHYDAGGTMVPFKAGSVDIRAQRLGDSGTLDDQFAGLNRRLNDGAVFGNRSFQLKQGDLVIGNGVKAGEVNVSVDNGSLTVLGTIDASGERVGSIRLAGRHGLTIGGGALLDAHGTVLRVDSRGKIIDAPNRAIVELSSGDGQLTLASGAHIDLRHGTGATVGNQPGQHDGQKRGTLELNAPRTGETSGDIRIDASGSLNIEGARSIALNAVWRYDDTDPLAVIKDGLDSVSGRPYREITQAYLDQKHAQSTKFIDAALANGELLHGKLAGLNNATYADALHLRPGVEIVTGKDLVVQGDLDLSGYRYASLNPRTQKTGVYGSGEAGSLVLRAAGNMDIYGSINDGFAPPPVTPDENGWALVPGVQPYNGDLVLPIGGVRLAEGTAFPSGTTLNYDLPIQELTLGAAVRLPAAATLAKPLTLTAGTVLAADVRDAAGKLLHARGTLLKDAVTLSAGTQLGAGTPLPSGTALRAMLWPKGVPLPVAYENDVVRNTVLLRGALELGRGALIPSTTRVVLENGVGYIELRPDSNGTRGRNWALAPMLPAGSESWAVRLVAGADLGAADTRIALANTGSLRLADTHYGATVTKGGGTLVWAENNNWGMPAGQPVTKEEEALCPLIDPGDCVSKTGIVWAPGNVFGEPAGTTVPDKDLPRCLTNVDACIDYGMAINVIAAHGQGISVVRTGTGDLDLIASGDIDARSLYGIYTAGTQSAGVDGRFNRARGNAPGATSVLGAGGADYESLVAGDGRVYQAWFPEAGGNLTVRAGGNLTSDMLSTPANDAAQKASVGVGNWLWRQGDGSAQLPTAWWINFGSYAVDPAGLLAADVKPSLVGFTGFGALGGGNVQVQAGGNAGMLERKGTARSQGLVVAVGSTGRVADDGSIVLTGGGDIDMRIGGGVNSSQLARGNANTTFVPNHDLQGALVNLRGATQLSAASVGGMILGGRDLKDPRAFDPFSSNSAESTGGLVLVPGDSAMRIDTLGDLVVGAAADAGRVRMQNSSPFSTGSDTYGGGGLSWFSLWTDRTAIDLFSAGGSLTPSTQMSESTLQSLTTSVNASASDYRFVYPAILRAVAAGGSIYNGAAANAASEGVNEFASRTSLLLAPSRSGQLELLAGDSLYMGSYAINQSGADPAAMPSPLKPAFTGFSGNTRVASNLGTEGLTMTARTDPFRLFAFAPETYAATDALRTPSRFYAMTGDIVGLRSGEIVAREDGRTWYEAAAPSWVMAGRDIVSAGTVLGKPAFTSLGGTGATSSGNLAIHGHAQDVSRVVAGRDILYSSFNVAGPGTLEVSAGRNIVMEDRAAIASLGPLTAGDKRLGASIAMMAGTGAHGADYSGFLARYLGAANRAQAGTSLASQSGKVVKTYEAELLAWLSDKDNGLGFSGTANEAQAFFDALPAEQQRVFARQVYFAELKASGREYNDARSARFGSYLRGRNAIAALFPESDAAGGAIGYRGDITMYGPAGVNTLFGGGIQVFTPGGAQVFGIEGNAPVAKGGITPGVITQGKGDISTYSLGSILLGQSRIMTTFGGHIMGWSAEGDINAGRGSKTTVVYTPPKREYDQWGNVTLSSNVPSTGAGIATLAPIAEVPAGDIDLIAPLGTIDAGEAGIRVSGNVNLAALQVVNAANIAVKGESAGIPTLAAVNVGALTNASAAASQAAGAAQDVLQRERAAQRQALPSVFTVRVLGFGDEPASGAPGAGEVRRKPAEQASYDPSGFIQMVGHGALTDAQIARLSESERRGLPRGR